MRRVLLSAVLVVLALILQLTVLDRLPLPGGVSPDLLLMVVVALALSSGPVPGLITGFCAGLALDIAPPANHLIGVYALVFCLVGYCCGLVAADLENSVLLPLAASALGAAAGAALYAVLGVFLGNPDVTGQSVRHVLPLSVLYDVLLSPFILYGVALASRLAARIAGAVVGDQQTVGSPLAVPGTPPAVPGGRTPRIRVAAARQRDGWIGGGGWLAASAELARSRPATVRLHLGSKGGLSNHPSGIGGTAGPQGAGVGQGAAKMRFHAGRRGDGVVGSRLLGGGFFGGLTGSAMPGPAHAPRLFSRRSRPAGAAPARFSRRPAWSFRAAGGPAGGSSPRRGSFSTGSPSKSPVSAATPRRGTFAVTPPRKRQAPAGSPRRGAFSGGPSTKGTFGSGAPRRGTFGAGPRRLRSLRRATFHGGSASSMRSRKGLFARVFSRRSSTFRGTPWWRTALNRTGYKRNGGWR